MSIRPSYRKRSVVQVLAHGMNAHPPTGRSCCEESELTANELARRNEELSQARRLRRSAEDDANWYRDLALKADRTIEEVEAERDEARGSRDYWIDLYGELRDELQAKLNDLMELAPAKQTTLDREAVKTILSRNFQNRPPNFDRAEKELSALAFEAANAWPEWLGDVPDKPEVKLGAQMATVGGNIYNVYNHTAKGLRAGAWELLALADAIDAEEAERNAEDEQRIEEQAKALHGELHPFGPSWENTGDYAQRCYITAIRAGWTPPENKENEA